MINKYAIIHGHFYQPPRETPWTGEIERQHTAAPYHNWNERITAECYTPNTASRVLNETNFINDIINNFQYFSFNFGATLIQWIEKHAPQTYKRIIEADKASMNSQNGHGNSMAQVYNHVIMPLASDDDKRTQIHWGIADFQSRFGRYPEGIWLAETAINNSTAQILMEYNLKFIVLSPHQAQRIKSFNSKSWIDVSAGIIDTRTPYRLFDKDDKGKIRSDKYIDVFFYNAGLSSAVGFEHLLTDSVRFADKITGVFDSWSSSPQAAIIATDGESYGHHEKNGDMCFSAFVSREIHNRQFKITNFGHYLEISPPSFEVELKTGHNNEGTAWSCAHGVGRWIRDCGCSDGGNYGWHQKWRGPFRDALNYLRNETEKIYKEKLNPYIKDLTKFRNEYINVVLGQSEKEGFLKSHLKDINVPVDKVTAFKLLEAQYNCQLSFTSCGWFFADISRIEPVQNLKYAAKTIEILSDFTKKNIESDFLNILEKAKSNIPQFEDGKYIYNNFVKAYIYKPEAIIGNYAIENFILNEVKDRDIFFYTAHSVLSEEKTNTATPVYKGMIKLINNKTDEALNYIYYLFASSFLELRCYILNSEANIEFNVATLNTIEAKIRDMAHHTFYSLKDLICDNRDKLMQLALKEEMQRLEEVFNNIYNKNTALLEILTQYDLGLPNVLREVCGFSLTNQINNIIDKSKKLASSEKIYHDYQKLIEMFITAKRLGLKPNLAFIEESFNGIIISNLESLTKRLDIKKAKTTLDFIELAEEIGLKLDLFTIQNIVYKLLRNQRLAAKNPKKEQPIDIVLNILRISKKLSFNTAKFASAIGIEQSLI